MRIDEIHAFGFEAVTVTYGRVVELSRFAKKRNIGLILLSDKSSKIIRAAGLLNGQDPPNYWSYGGRPSDDPGPRPRRRRQPPLLEGGLLGPADHRYRARGFAKMSQLSEAPMQ
jgi:hypothetical protein